VKEAQSPHEVTRPPLKQTISNKALQEKAEKEFEKIKQKQSRLSRVPRQPEK